MINIIKTIQAGGKLPAFFIRIGAQLLDNTRTKTIDAAKLSSAIITQSKSVYCFSNAHYSCSLEMNVEVIRSVHDVSKHKLLFCVIDEVRNGNPAEADFKGLRIALNKSHIASILSGENTRTIPHELGHIFGWEHPHARGKYESVNPDANKLFEQNMTEAERKINLMSQTWYIQNAGGTQNDGTALTFGQLELLYRNYQARKLSNNYHLKGILWWKKLI